MANDIKRVDTADVAYCCDAGRLKPTKRQSAALSTSPCMPPPEIGLLASHCPAPDTRINANGASMPRVHLLAARNLLSARRFSPQADTDTAETELPILTVPLARIMNKYLEDKPLYKIAQACERLLIKPAPPCPEPGRAGTDATAAMGRRADKLAELFEQCSKAQDGSPEARELLHIIRKMHGRRADTAARPPGAASGSAALRATNRCR